MCDPDWELNEIYRRNEARRRAQIANKCAALKAVDAAIEAMRGEGLKPCIGEVLMRAHGSVSIENAGAGDTVRRLLELEGWK